MYKLAKVFKEAVERRRARLRMSKTELARAAGMSPQQLGNVLNDDDADVRLTLVERLAAALQVSPFALLRTEAEEQAHDEKLAKMEENDDNLFAQMQSVRADIEKILNGEASFVQRPAEALPRATVTPAIARGAERRAPVEDELDVSEDQAQEELLARVRQLNAPDAARLLRAWPLPPASPSRRAKKASGNE